MQHLLRCKFSVNAAFFGLQRDRYTQYQPPRSLEEKLALVAQVEGVQGVELKYPFDFQDVRTTRQLVADYALTISAVNVDIKDANHFRYGALSAIDASARAHALTLIHEGMDIAAEVGASIVTTCPLADAYEYPFQIDYSEAWARFIEAVRAAAAYRSDVQFVLEYQPHDMQARSLLNNVGKVLYVCTQVGLPNLGANLDIGHAFAAGESPAEAATLLAGAKRLFYIHTNDNTGDGGDWDMISGSVHLWHWLELLYTLERVGYDGWLGADIAAHQLDPVAAFDANTRMLRRMISLLGRLDLEALEQLVHREHNTPALLDFWGTALLGD